MKKNCKLLSENSSERLKLYVKAFCAEDNTSALASISQAKLLTIGGTKFIQNIKRYQVSMQFLRCIRFSHDVDYAKNKFINCLWLHVNRKA